MQIDKSKDLTVAYRYSSHIITSRNIYKNINNKDYRLVFSGRSGKILLLTLDDFDYLNRREIPKTSSKLHHLLVDAQMLVDKEVGDLEAIVKRNQSFIDEQDNLYFVILPTTFCNMGCTYCGQEHQKGGISKKGSDIIITRIKNALLQTKARGLNIGWFGGEPLVNKAKLISISDELIHFCDHHSISYGAKIVTNGSLLTMKLLEELVHRCRIQQINITFDGPREIHDRRRFMKNGKKSFDHITTLVKNVINNPTYKNLEFIFRTNIDKENHNYIDQYLEDMYKLGLYGPNIQYDLKAVYSWSNDVTQVQMAHQEFAQNEARWMAKMLGYGMNVGSIPSVKKSTCTATSVRSEVISSTGNIFSCTEHPLVPIHEFQDAIGRVFEPWKNKRRPKGEFDDFYSEVLSDKVPCNSCKFFGVCGGACPKQWKANNIPCPSFKFNMQERLDIYAIQQGLRIVT